MPTLHVLVETAKEFGQPGNLVLGANIAGFRVVAVGAPSRLE